MQLHLETDELNLLADILLEQDQRRYADLLDKVLVHDLRFDTDELEQTADMLAAEERRLQGAIDGEPSPARKDEMRGQLALLDRLLERVNEACVMF